MEDTSARLGTAPSERSEKSLALYPNAAEGFTDEGVPVVWLRDSLPKATLTGMQHQSGQIRSLPAPVDIDRALKEMLEPKDLSLRSDISLAKIWGYCLAGGLLGCCYCRLAFVEWDVNSGAVVTILCLPCALYFLKLGESYEVYLPGWDALLGLLILAAIGFDITVMILKAILVRVGLEGLPDLAIFIMVAVVCFGRALGWACMGILLAGARRKVQGAELP